MRILIACEESQAVCIEMRRLGHEAYSCDIQECSGGHPEWHIKGDALELLKMKWDMIIAHPPCTYLSAAGSQRTFPKAGHADPERYEKGEEAARFFSAFLNADCEHIAVENPVPMTCFGLPKYDQIIHPYMFGHPWYKRTCLWLKGLPPLFATELVEPTGYWVQRSGQRARGVRGGTQRPEAQKQNLPRNRQGDGRAVGRGHQREERCGMNMNEYQVLAQRTCNITNAPEDKIMNGCMGLNGEAGECIDLLKKAGFQGCELVREKLIEELGDALWCCAKLATGLGVTLEEVAQRNIDKLRRRYPEGFSAERSRNREE